MVAKMELLNSVCGRIIEEAQQVDLQRKLLARLRKIFQL